MTGKEEGAVLVGTTQSEQAALGKLTANWRSLIDQPLAGVEAGLFGRQESWRSEASMSQHDELFKALDDLRWRTAKFLRVGLHVHSPESRDWGTNGDKTLNDREKFLKPGGEQDFIEHLKPHFDLVTITDHMKCSFASTLSNRSDRSDTTPRHSQNQSIWRQVAIG